MRQAAWAGVLTLIDGAPSFFGGQQKSPGAALAGLRVECWGGEHSGVHWQELIAGGGGCAGSRGGRGRHEADRRGAWGGRRHCHTGGWRMEQKSTQAEQESVCEVGGDGGEGRGVPGEAG